VIRTFIAIIRTLIAIIRTLIAIIRTLIAVIRTLIAVLTPTVPVTAIRLGCETEAAAREYPVSTQKRPVRTPQYR
jgi:hypothetical protein